MPATQTVCVSPGALASEVEQVHPVATPTFATRLQGAVARQYLPLSFLVALAFAISWPLPGREVASWQAVNVRIVQAINNCCVFLVSGLTLRTEDCKDAVRQWLGLLYGNFAILGITPCLGFAAKHIPLQPKEFATGLALFCVVPTTLGVGVALTAAAKGNHALALLLTVGTNLLGILTVPYLLKLVLKGSSTVSVDPGSLVGKLILTVLVPTVVGKALRSLSARVRSFVSNYKTALSLFSHTNLACIVWQTLSGAHDALVAQRFISILLVIVASALQHLVYLVFNVIAVFGLRLPAPEAIAVLIMSSQKSAPVAVTVISYISPDIAQQGLFAIPAIVGQVTQIFVGSLMVKRLSTYVDKQD